MTSLRKILEFWSSWTILWKDLSLSSILSVTGNQQRRSTSPSQTKSDTSGKSWNSSMKARSCISKREQTFSSKKLKTSVRRASQIKTSFSKYRTLWGMIRRPSKICTNKEKVWEVYPNKYLNWLRDWIRRGKYMTWQHRFLSQSRNWRNSKRAFWIVPPKKTKRY